MFAGVMLMFNLSVQHVSILTSANWHYTQSTAEADGHAISFADIWL